MSTVTLAPWIVAKAPMTGYPVQSVQHLLRAHKPSIPASSVDGQFGPATKTRVKAFQATKGLVPQDGVVGKKTWLKLIITIRRGSSGPAVKALQEVVRAQHLNTAGSSTFQVDGLFGPLTEQFVEDWQAFRGLDQDGIVGPLTWQSLMGGLPF